MTVMSEFKDRAFADSGCTGDITEKNRNKHRGTLSDAWASTMRGVSFGSDHVLAHGDETANLFEFDISYPNTRERRENIERLILSEKATLSLGAGNRKRIEEPDEFRTCFQKDRDRILHSSVFRRLAGKTQVFIFPSDHQRTRLTHALEVAQVAVAISRALNLNVDLTEAIALGHDCGHGPGGHASEEAFSIYLAAGFDHASFGADKALRSLNLCHETLDGIRNHTWSKPSPYTQEGQVVSWADRIAYICHDFEDAKSAKIVSQNDLSKEISKVVGEARRSQLNTFISSVIRSSIKTGVVSMFAETANALSMFRKFNYEHIYMRPESLEQSRRIIEMLQSLVEFYISNESELKSLLRVATDLSDVVIEKKIQESRVDTVVECVAKMTDKYAMDLAVEKIGYSKDKFPDLSGGFI